MSEDSIYLSPDVFSARNPIHTKGHNSNLTQTTLRALIHQPKTGTVLAFVLTNDSEGLMRRLLPLGSLLLFSGLAHAGVVSFSFSGTWSSTFGVVQAGDAFSGTATWDTAAIGANPSFPTYALLLSYSLTMPAGEGLSVDSIPDSKVLFAGAHYILTGPQPGCSSFPCFENLQINEQSSTDNNVYVFELGGVSGCVPAGHCDAEVANPSFTTQDFAATYGVAGPTATPEPGTSALIFGGLVLFALRRKTTSVWVRRSRA